MTEKKPNTHFKILWSKWTNARRKGCT